MNSNAHEWRLRWGGEPGKSLRGNLRFSESEGEMVLMLHGRFSSCLNRTPDDQLYRSPVEILAELWADEQRNQDRADAAGRSFEQLLRDEHRLIQFCRRCVIDRVSATSAPHRR